MRGTEWEERLTDFMVTEQEVSRVALKPKPRDFFETQKFCVAKKPFRGYSSCTSLTLNRFETIQH